MEEVNDVLFSIGPLEVTGRVTTMWAIIAVLTLLSWLATRNMKEVPGRLQNAAELAVAKLLDYFDGTLGKSSAGNIFRYLPHSLSLLLSATIQGCSLAPGI